MCNKALDLSQTAQLLQSHFMQQAARQQQQKDMAGGSAALMDFLASGQRQETTNVSRGVPTGYNPAIPGMEGIFTPPTNGVPYATNIPLGGGLTGDMQYGTKTQTVNVPFSDPQRQRRFAAMTNNLFAMQQFDMYSKAQQMFSPKYEVSNVPTVGMVENESDPITGRVTGSRVLFPAQDNSETMLERWLRENPGKGVSDYMKQQAHGRAYPPELTKLINDRDAIAAQNPNDPKIALYDQAILKSVRGVETLTPFVGTGGGVSVWSNKTGAVGDAVTPDGAPISKVPNNVVEAQNWFKNLRGSIGEIRSAMGAGSKGPVAGRAQKFGQLFFSNAEVESLLNRIEQLRPIVYAFSGKQINESELAWLQKIIPDIVQPKENFETRLGELESWLDRMQKNLQESFPGLKSVSGEKQSSKSSGRYTIEEVK